MKTKTYTYYSCFTEENKNLYLLFLFHREGAVTWYMWHWYNKSYLTMKFRHFIFLWPFSIVKNLQNIVL